MKRVLIFICVAVLAISGCISNDIPYPVVVPSITALDVENAKSVDVDYNNRVVTHKSYSVIFKYYYENIQKICK